MKMRLTGSDALPRLKLAFDGARPALDPWLARAQTGLDRLAPYGTRLTEELRKHPKLAAGAGAIAGTWSTLVAAFCATIDPYLSRWFPDLRLVAIATPSGEIELHKIVKGAATPLGPLTALDPAATAEVAQAKWTAVELRLRPEQLLHRTLTLPAASRDFLGPIIEHKLDRLTPWRPDRVLYGYRTLGEADAGGGVTVALTATSKDFVAAPLQALGAAGLAPTAIGGHETALNEPLGINLLRDTARSNRIDSRRMVSRVALTTFGVLAVVWLGSSWWASSASDDQQTAAARLMKARRLLKSASMGAIGDAERELLDAKAPDKSMVVLIDKLASAIPEDTYLKELAVTPDKVRLVGVSSNAPALVSEIQSTGLLNVRFTSAVTREKDQRDTFEITADRMADVPADAP